MRRRNHSQSRLLKQKMVEEFLAHDHAVPILLSSLDYKELGRSACVCRVLWEVARGLPDYGERGRVLRLIENKSDGEPLVNLQSLYLQGNQISDVSPLATLVSLQTLWLSRNQGLDKDAVKRMFSKVRDLRI